MWMCKPSGVRDIVSNYLAHGYVLSNWLNNFNQISEIENTKGWQSGSWASLLPFCLASSSIYWRIGSAEVVGLMAELLFHNDYVCTWWQWKLWCIVLAVYHRATLVAMIGGRVFAPINILICQMEKK